LSLYRSDQPAGPISGMYEPSVALVLKGRKRVGLGSESFVYGPGQCLVTSLHLPTVTHILEASPEQPFLSLLLALDMREITSLMMDGNLPAPRAQVGERAMAVGRVDWPLAHAIASALRIDDLAGEVRMSPSTFHHHFKTLTAMSPLQYQKWLRLNEARRSMLTERVDASTAAFKVGYESVSQFSREYSRQFGAPPMRDISSLRTTTVEAAG
jgi:AraC-like DNA-binding protein